MDFLQNFITPGRIPITSGLHHEPAHLGQIPPESPSQYIIVPARNDAEYSIYLINYLCKTVLTWQLTLIADYTKDTVGSEDTFFSEIHTTTVHVSLESTVVDCRESTKIAETKIIRTLSGVTIIYLKIRFND